MRQLSPKTPVAQLSPKTPVAINVNELTITASRFSQYTSSRIKYVCWRGYLSPQEIQTQSNIVKTCLKQVNKQENGRFLYLIILLGGLPVTVDDVINRARKMISYQCLYLLLSSHRSVASQWKSSADSVYQRYQYGAQIYVLSE